MGWFDEKTSTPNFNLIMFTPMKEWWLKFKEAFSKPEAERAAAIAALGDPPEFPAATGAGTGATAGASATSGAAGATDSETQQKIMAQLKLIEDLTKTIAEMKKAQDDRTAAFDAQTKKELEQKIAAKLEEAKKTGRIAAKDDVNEAFWKKQLESNFDESAKVLDSLPAKTSQSQSQQQQQSGQGQGTAGTGTPPVADLRRAAAEAFSNN
jgi:hypothetical protein